MKNVIVLFALALSVGFIVLVANSAPEETKEERLEKCIDQDPSDRGCDSCFYAVYGYYNPDTTQYSYGHYNAE